MMISRHFLNLTKISLNRNFLVHRQLFNLSLNESKPRLFSSLTSTIKNNQTKLVAQIRNKNVVYFSTTPRNNAIPPLIWVIVKPLSKLSSIIVGRGFRKWWSSLPAAKRTLALSHFKRNKHRYASLIVFVTFSSVIFYQTHLQENPITKRKRFILFTRDQLKEVAQLGVESIKENNKGKILDPNSQASKKALRVANRLFVANKNLPGVSDIDWRLTVVDDKTVNAVAFPNGSIIVYTGLIKHCKSDDELAIILAHEMSHAILEHSVEAMSYGRLLDIISIFSIFIIWSLIPSDVVALLGQWLANEFMKIYYDLPYSRQLESEADEVGLMLAARACFDVRKSVTFWKEISEESEGQEIEEYLSTHPSSINRSNDLAQLVPQALKLREECNCYELRENVDYLKAIKNMLEPVQKTKD